MGKAKSVTANERALNFLLLGRPAAAYKAAVREAVEIRRSLELPGVDCENIMYTVLSKAPPESFFCGAYQESLKLVKEITGEKRLGDVETGIYTIENLFGMQCRRVEGDMTLELYKQVLGKGIKEGDEVAIIRGFYPLGDLDVKSRMPSKFKRRGIGGHVLDHVVQDLKRKGAKAVFAIYPSDDVRPLLEKHGFEQLSKFYYFKRFETDSAP